jgi:hypothetical protein
MKRENRMAFETGTIIFIELIVAKLLLDFSIHI